MAIVDGSRPPPTAAEIEGFERSSGLRVPQPVLWFLANIANGGRPDPEVDFPIEALDGKDRFSCIHALYGIGCKERYYQLEEALTMPWMGPLLDRVFPIASDDLNGHVFLRTIGAFEGEIWYSPWHLLADDDLDPEDKLFRVLPDIQSFGALITETS